MNNEKRACLAFICASQIVGAKVRYVYDLVHREYKNYHLDLQNDKIVVYDYQRRSYMSGLLPNLYDYQSSSYVRLDINGNKFKGYDYDCQAYFSGEITGDNIRFYDYSVSDYFFYRALM